MIIASSLQDEDRSGRWLVLVSLALNLFLIGTAGALIVRHYWAPTVNVAAPIDRSATARIERIAMTLPVADAEITRAEFRANAATLDLARNNFEYQIDRMRETFRAEPYNVEMTRSAMAEARAARQHFEELLQDVIASSAAKMSALGRAKLAEYSSNRTAPAPSR